MVNKMIQRRSLIYDMRRGYVLYLMLVLPIAFYIIFRYIPMYGVTIAFKQYNIFQGIMNSPWAGFQIFEQVFAKPEFFRALRNTLLLNFLDLIFGFPAPIFIALILNEIRIKWFARTSQALIYLPYFMSWVIIGGITYQIFSTHNGILNVVIKSIGLEPIPFLTEKWHWIFTYVGIGIWQSMGYGTIIYLAAIAGVNQDLYEAAKVDGANRVQQIWHITLPSIRPTIAILLIISLGRILMISFDRPYVFGNGYVMDFSDVISTYVYRTGIQSMQFSFAAAVGLFQSFIGMIFLLLSNFLTNKLGEQGIW